MTTIQETTDYEMFTQLRVQNPERAKKNAKGLIASLLRTDGNIVPIIVNEKNQVIDGNTRLEASKIAGTKVRYIQVKGSAQRARETMLEINSNQKQWKLMEYIYFFAQNSEAYKGIQRVLSRTSLNENTVVELLGLSTNQVKHGGNISPNYDMYNLLSPFVAQLNEVSDNKISVASAGRALKEIYGYGFTDFTGLIDKVETHHTAVSKDTSMKKPKSRDDVLEFLQQCYNKRRSEDDKTRIYKEKL